MSRPVAPLLFFVYRWTTDTVFPLPPCRPSITPCPAARLLGPARTLRFLLLLCLPSAATRQPPHTRLDSLLPSYATTIPPSFFPCSARLQPLPHDRCRCGCKWDYDGERRSSQHKRQPWGHHSRWLEGPVASACTSVRVGIGASRPIGTFLRYGGRGLPLPHLDCPFICPHCCCCC